MPTLLSVNNYYYHRDGSETVYFEHNRLFQSQGWDIVPFSVEHPKNYKSQWSEYFVKDIEYGEEYSLLEKLQRAPKVVYSFEAQKKVSALIEKANPDICHCHTIYHHLSPSILGKIKQHDIPIVMTIHDLKLICPAYHMHNERGVCEDCHSGVHNVVVNKCIKNSTVLSLLVFTEAVTHRMLNSYARNVDKFISPCRFYIDKLVEWGWPEEQFVHIPNPIDVENYKPHYKPGEYALYFGRLSPEKGLVTLIRSAAKAGIPLQIAGGGPQLSELQQLVQELKANVQFLGHLSGHYLAAAIAHSRVTVLASEWYENAPMSILESFAYGKPAIGADIGGIPELLHSANEEPRGMLFESGSESSLTSALKTYWALSDKEIVQQGEAARRFVEQFMSSKHYKERVNDLYQSVQRQ